MGMPAETFKPKEKVLWEQFFELNSQWAGFSAFQSYLEC